MIVLCATEAANGLTFENILSYVRNLLGEYGFGILFTAFVIGITLVIQRYLINFIHDRLSSSNVTELSLFVNLARGALWLGAAGVIAETVFHVKLDTLFTALGVTSLLVSLGLQDLIKNIVAGMGIVTHKVFKVGDNIEIGDHRGEVMDITWRQTVIRDVNGDPRAIPNALINTQVVTRHDEAMAYRYELNVEVWPTADLDEVAKTFERIAREQLERLGLKAEGHDPAVRFLGHTAYGVKCSIRLFLGDIEYRTPAFNVVMRAISKTGYLADSTNVEEAPKLEAPKL